MRKVNTKFIALNGIMMALVLVTTMFTRIPVPMVKGGYFNIGDTVIMVSAMVLGKYSGLLTGAIGSALADVFLGASFFAPLTLVVKGLEGFAVGFIAESRMTREIHPVRKIAAVTTGALIMIFGYLIGEATVLASYVGWTAAVSELPVNMLQGGVSAVFGYLLSSVLLRMKIRKFIL